MRTVRIAWRRSFPASTRGTRHIHVKAQREGGDVLTTQLYFPNEPSNEGSGIFDPALLLSRAGGGDARFDFVLV